MKETDLALLFENNSELLLYKEVLDIDALHVSKELITSYEFKVSFNIKLIDQTIARRHLSHYSYMVIPKSKYKDEFLDLKPMLTKLGIGLILVSDDKNEVVIESLYKEVNNPNAILDRLNKDYLKTVSGARTGQSNSPYKQMIDKVIELLRASKQLTTEELVSSLCLNNKNPEKYLERTLAAKWNQEFFKKEKQKGTTLWSLKEGN